MKTDLNLFLRLVRYNVQGLLQGRNRPLVVSFSLTDKCQNNCAYCGITKRNLPDLSSRAIVHIMKKLRKAGCLRLGFTGGEPLLRNDFRHVSRAAARLGFHLTLNTNGILLNEHRDIWDLYRVFFISLDGMGPSHEALRKKPTTKELLSLIGELKEASKKVITTTVICRENLNDTDYIIDRAQEMGFLADFELFSPHSLSSPVWLPSTRELYRVFKNILSRKKDGAPIATSSTTLKMILHVLKKGEYPRRLTCVAGRFSAFVDTDGAFYPCFDMRGRVSSSTEFSDLEIVQSYCDFCRCNGSLELNTVYSLYPGAILSNLRWW